MTTSLQPKPTALVDKLTLLQAANRYAFLRKQSLTKAMDKAIVAANATTSV